MPWMKRMYSPRLTMGQSVPYITSSHWQMAVSQVRSSPAYESNAREISLDPVNKLIDDIVKANAG